MFKRKTIISVLFSLIFLFSFCVTNTFASDSPQNNAIKVLLNGQYLQFKEPPVEKDGSTLVPMREIFEALGATLSWDASTSTATGTKGNSKIILQLDNTTAFINDSPVTLSVPGTLVNDKTMVPTRFIAESMNCIVSWDEGTRTVIIMPNTAIEFEDKKFEKAVKSALNISKETLTTADVAKLTSLVVKESDIKSLKGIQYLINLNTLDIQKNNVGDISLLSGLIKLEKLNFSDNKIKDISALRKLLNIKDLNIESNYIQDISSLSSLDKLESLYIGNNKINDISVLKNLKSIKYLSAYYTLIEDITALSSLENLEQLDISYSQITDISSLKNCLKLNKLNIYGNAVLDVSAIKSLKSLKSFYYENFKDKTQINDELFTKNLDLVNKAESIIKKIITPGMSAIDKELAIHDYIILNTTYNSDNYVNGTVSNEDNMPYGVLINGAGTCIGYSSTMKALLKLVNIDSLIVYGYHYNLSSLPSSYVWIMVETDGSYYHVDVTSDDTDIVEEINTLSHRYFNLSNRQISANHKFDKQYYPEAKTDSVDFERYIKDNHNLVINDDYTFIIYDQLLYRIDNSNQTGKQISNDKISEIAYYDGWIYYINGSDNYKIYKMKDDGTEKTLIIDNPTDHLYVINNSVIYVNGFIISSTVKSYLVFKSDLDGKNITQIISDKNVLTLYFYDNYLYYKSLGNLSRPSFLKAHINGEHHVYLLSSGFASKMTVNNKIGYTSYQLENIKDGWIYYVNADNKNKIFRFDLDGKHESVVSENSVYNNNYYIIGDWIYYSNASDSKKIYKVKIDGSQNTIVDIKL